MATQGNREVKIKTPLGEDVLLLLDMTMTEELGRLFTMDLELMSTKEDIKFEALLGQNITVELDLSTGSKRYFNGHVTRLSQSGNRGAFAVYQATVRPWLWFLTRTSDCRIFQKKTVPEIVKEIMAEQGFTDVEEKLEGEFRKWEYCVQYRETDFNFVSRLLEQEGIYYYFEHSEGVHKLVLSNYIGSHDPLPDTSEIPYYPPDETTLREEEYISSWFVSKQIQPGKYVLNEYNFERPSADLKSQSSIKQEHSSADYEIYDYPGEYGKLDEGDSYAQARIEEIHTQYEQAQGQSVVRALKTGHLFKLKDYPRSDQNREYLIVSATHSLHSDDYGSGGGGGEIYSNSFSVIDRKTPFRPARTTPKPLVQGAQTAMVVGPAGEEIHTDEHGRVKLHFYWDRYSKQDENSSCWIRVSQVHAGKGFGGIDIPRIGEEVIVEFLEGDPDRPIVTGRVYNGDNKAPTDLPKKKMVSGLKSNTTPGGGGSNEITLDDTKEKELINVHAQYNMSTTVEHDDLQTIHNNRAIKVDGTHTETVDCDVTETYNKKQKTTVANEIVITSTESHIHITASTQIKLKVGASTLEMNSDGTIKLEGANITIHGTESVTTKGGSVTSKADVDHNTKGTIVISDGAASNTVKGGMVMLNP